MLKLPCFAPALDSSCGFLRISCPPTCPPEALRRRKLSATMDEPFLGKSCEVPLHEPLTPKIEFLRSSPVKAGQGISCHDHEPPTQPRLLAFSPQPTHDSRKASFGPLRPLRPLCQSFLNKWRSEFCSRHPLHVLARCCLRLARLRLSLLRSAQQKN